MRLVHPLGFFILFVLLRPVSLCAQGSDSLRRYEGEEVVIEDDREGLTVRGVEVKIVPIGKLQTLTGATRVNDLITGLTPSIAARKYGGLGGITLVSYRGLPTEYTIVFRDGVRLTNEQNSFTDLARVSASSVQAIELLPSTSAILLGGDVIGAAINLRSPTYTGDRVTVGNSVLSFNEFAPGELEHTVSIAKSLAPDWNVFASASRQYSRGNYPFTGITGLSLERENNDAQLNDLFLSLRYDNEALPVRLTASHVRAKRGVPGATTIRTRGASAFFARQNDEDLYLSLDSKLEVGGWFFTPLVSYQSQDETYVDPQVRIDDRYTNDLYFAQLRVERSLTSDLEVYAGASLQPNTFRSNAISTPAAHRTRYSAYTASSYQASEDLLVIAAARGEYLSDLATMEVLPQVSLHYGTSTPIVTHLSMGLSYHAPTLNQLHWKTYGNLNLKPEHAENVEAGMTFKIPIGMEGLLKAGVNFFHITSRNQILWQPTGGSQFRPINVHNSRTQGLEYTASIDVRPLPDLTLSLSGGYTILDARNITDGSSYSGNRLPFSARTQSLMQVLASHTDAGSLGFTISYRGPKYADLGNTSDSRLGVQTIVNASYSLPELRILGDLALALQLSVENLADVPYYEIHNYPLPGRSFRLTTTITYLPTNL